MKVIITESQEKILSEQLKQQVGALGGKMAGWAGSTKLGKQAAGKVADVAVNKKMAGDGGIELSPEMQSRFSDINIERDSPNLAKFLSGLKNAGNVEALAATVKGEPLPDLPAGDEMIHPLGKIVPISSKFGHRDVEVGSADHQGVDLSVPSGSPVYAPLDGVVEKSLDTTPNGCGGHVRLKHKYFDTKFCHLSRMVAKVGRKVKKGDIIGYSGGAKTDPHPGVSSGAHLHYAIVNKKGIHIDPLTGPTNLV